MNEATLEGRLNAELSRLFPSLNRVDITHQKSFTLKFGHNNIQVNGNEKNKAGGRLDVLISYKGKPLAILELKAPNVNLDQDDMEQGISYARLLNPMPPIVVLTNGCDTRFYRSFDMSPWIASNIDEEAIQELFKAGASCAEAEHDHAVKVLLGQQPELWGGILKKYTEKQLGELVGKVDEFSFPIAKDFQIERLIKNEILGAVQQNPLVNFIGDPLSGKTNVVYQFCQACPSNIFPLYIDSSTNYGVLQLLANRFSSSLFKQMKPDDVRHWMINSFRNRTDIRIIIIIDNLVDLNNSDIWKDIFELIDINDNNVFSILLILNNFIYDNIGSLFGRTSKNKIGKAPVIKLLPLSDDEFDKVHYEINENFESCFHPGAQYNNEYRNPRLLRVLIANLIRQQSFSKPQPGTKVLLPSITTFNLLKELWNNMVTDITLQADLRCFVKAILSEESTRKKDPLLSIMSVARGAITLKTAEKILGNNRIDRLESNGFIQRYNIDGGKSYISPRFPEALSAAAAFYLKDELVDMFSNEKTELYNFLKGTVPLFPYGDLVAVMAIFEACKMEPDILSLMIEKLLEDEPNVEKISKKGKHLVFFEDVGAINVEREMEGKITSNWYPWLILSHLASLPLGDTNRNRDIQLKILAKIGSFGSVLLRVDNIPLAEMKGYHVHDKEEVSFLCGKVGIIEPITYAIQCGFYSMPERMIDLSKWAIMEGNESFLMRLSTAAYSTVDCCESQIGECSRKVLEVVSDRIKKFYNDVEE